MRIKRFLIPLLLFFCTLAIYIHNLARGIYAGDVGDFVSASYVGGIAHAPGYPFFVLLGFILTRIPFFPTPAYAVGLLSALAGAGCLVFVYLLCLELTEDTFASFLASITLGFSFLFWFYSEVAEVFVLNAFFISLLFFLALRIRKHPTIRKIYFFAFCIGLSLTNHQTIIFIFPSLFLLLFPATKKLFSFKKLFIFLVFFILGFSLYIYPFIATLRHPIINWDPVTNISSFLRLILREDYGTFNSGPFGKPSLLQRIVILKTYGMYTLIQLTLAVIAISTFGLFTSWKKNKTVWISLFLAFFLIGPLFIFYAGFPPIGNYYDGVFERFLLASHIFIVIFFAIGLSAFLKLLFRISNKSLSKILFRGVFLIIPLMLFIYNFPKTDLSHFFLTEQFAKDILSPLPHNSMLFTTGDTATFNVWYVRYVLHERTDVDLVNMGGLAVDKSYIPYRNSYLSTHPHASTADLTAEILLFIAQKRPVFALEAIEPSKKVHLTWVPEGFTYRLLGNNVSFPKEDTFLSITKATWKQIHIPDSQSLHKNVYGDVSAADIPSNYATAILTTGDFFLSKYKDASEAKVWFDKALALDPTLDNVHGELGIYYVTTRQCSLAASEFKKGIALNQLQIPTYLLLYETYIGCLHDPISAKTLADNFRQIFKENITSALATYLKKK